MISWRIHHVSAMLLIAGGILLTCGLSCEDAQNNEPAGSLTRIIPPASGTLYHGVYPGGESGEEDDFTAADIQSYIDTVGENVAWVYFSHNWYRSRAFPQALASTIRDAGAVPFVRLMLRSSSEQNEAEPLYTLDAIIAGRFDSDLSAWGESARNFSTPLLVEWGTECNGEWFSWNGTWNGADETTGFGDLAKADGPERFVSAFRHIVTQIRAANADNVTFVWHVNNDDIPDESWNRLEEYYPGDDVVDWLAVSVYGPLTPLSDDAPDFTASLDNVYPRLVALAGNKPIIVAEFGCTANNPNVTPQAWADDALGNLIAGRWPRIIGFSWWNEYWQNDDNPAHDTNMRVQDTPALGAVFYNQFAAHEAQLATSAAVETVP